MMTFAPNATASDARSEAACVAAPCICPREARNAAPPNTRTGSLAKETEETLPISCIMSPRANAIVITNTRTKVS
jgi:hypothetical protein